MKLSRKHLRRLIENTLGMGAPLHPDLIEILDKASEHIFVAYDMSKPGSPIPSNLDRLESLVNALEDLTKRNGKLLGIHMADPDDKEQAVNKYYDENYDKAKLFKEICVLEDVNAILFTAGESEYLYIKGTNRISKTGVAENPDAEESIINLLTKHFK